MAVLLMSGCGVLASCGQPNNAVTSSSEHIGSTAYPAPLSAAYPAPRKSIPAPTPQEAPLLTIPNDSPMLHASPEQVGEAAILHTKQSYGTFSGTPKVVLARPFANNEWPLIDIVSLGFDDTNAPPMMVVVVKGDFDVSSIPMLLSESSVQTRVKYVAYVYDLRAGIPIVTSTSTNGGSLRTLLNDPTIPLDLTVLPAKAAGTPEALPVQTWYAAAPTP